MSASKLAPGTGLGGTLLRQELLKQERLPSFNNRFGSIAPYKHFQGPTSIRQSALTAEPKKSLFQTLTQRKVLIAVGAILGVAGVAGAAAAAYYFYPVATAAHAATVGHAGRAVAMNMQELVIRPGFANTMLMANLAMKMAVIPAAHASSIVVLPMIGTVVMTTLLTLGILYVANKVWKAVEATIWGAGTAIANKISEQLDQTGLGKGVKMLGRGAQWLVAPVTSFIKSVATAAEASSEELPQIESSANPKKARANKAQSNPPSTVLENAARFSVIGVLIAAGYYLYNKNKADV